MTFSIIEVADSMGWESRILRSELTGLQVNDRGTCSVPSGGGGRSSVVVEIEELAFHLTVPGDLTTEERESVIQSLTDQVLKQEMRDVEKLHLLHAVLRSVATETLEGGSGGGAVSVATETLEGGGAIPEVSLEGMIERYFSNDGLSVSDLTREGIAMVAGSPELSIEEEDLIGRDTATLVLCFSDVEFTGRAVARIFHGIPSPRFPAVVWGSQRGFWRKHLQVDFNRLCHLATRKLIEH